MKLHDFKKITQIIFFLSVYSCQNIEEKSNLSKKFLPPKLADEVPFSNSMKVSKSIEEAYYPILGVYPFAKEIMINEKEWNPWDTSIKKIEPIVADGLQIYIDTNQKLSIQRDTSEPNLIKNTQKNYQAYPCFIFNETKSIKWLHCQDGNLVATLEAFDSNYYWRPIEVWMWPWCGNSNYRVPIKPDYFALTKIPIFKGNFKTKLRLKIYTRDVLYYSQTFNGSIDYSQFNKPKEITNKDGSFKYGYDFIEIRKNL